MTPEDQQAFQSACKDWAVKSAGQDIGEYFFKAACAHRDAVIAELNSELSKWMHISDEAKKGLENRAQLIAAQHANESLSAVNQQMLKALKKCAAVCAGETLYKQALIDALEVARTAIDAAEAQAAHSEPTDDDTAAQQNRISELAKRVAASIADRGGDYSVKTQAPSRPLPPAPID